MSAAIYVGVSAAAVFLALLVLLAILLVRKLKMRHRGDLQNISRTCTEQGLGEFTAPIDAEARGDLVVAVREWINLERTLAHPKKLVAAFWDFWSKLSEHALKDPDTRQQVIDRFNKLVASTASPAASVAPQPAGSAPAAVAPAAPRPVAPAAPAAAA